MCVTFSMPVSQQRCYFAGVGEGTLRSASAKQRLPPGMRECRVLHGRLITAAAASSASGVSFASHALKTGSTIDNSAGPNVSRKTRA